MISRDTIFFGIHWSCPARPYCTIGPKNSKCPYHQVTGLFWNSLNDSLFSCIINERNFNDAFLQISIVLNKTIDFSISNPTKRHYNEVFDWGLAIRTDSPARWKAETNQLGPKGLCLGLAESKEIVIKRKSSQDLN